MNLYKNSPILFLDIDGVLAPFNNPNVYENHPDVHSEFYLFNKDCNIILNDIIEKTNCEIVISSDWRLYYTLNELKCIFEKNEILKSPIAVTIEKDFKSLQNLESNRCYEINEFVKNNDISKWCALDDLDLSGLGESHFVFCTKPYTEGIKQLSIKEKLIKKLTI
jgi:hypothetical protein